MRNIVWAAALSLVFCASALAQNMYNGTQQVPNVGFEEWDNVGSSSIEPGGWNSFMTANASGVASAGKTQRVRRGDGGRPGTKGRYYAVTYSNSVMNVVANGNLTTGRINMGSTEATSSANHNFTDRGSNGFFARLTQVPDSIVVWVNFKPKNSSYQAQINAIIHNENNTQDPATNFSQVVAQAKINPATTNGQWKRFAAPFNRTGKLADNQARYILISITTNKIPGGGSDGDEIWVDDMLLIYKPTLNIDKTKFNTKEIPIAKTIATKVEIPFIITGTMSPFLGQDNIVKAQLSDKNGKFNDQTSNIIGQITTDVSSSITAEIPGNVEPSNKYRIRLISTNYPLVSSDNGFDISLYNSFGVNATVAEATRGKITSGTGGFKAGSSTTLTAVAERGNHFAYWEENGAKIEGAGERYTIDVNRDYNLIAHFDTNYYSMNLSVEGEGEASFEPNLGEGNKYIHGSEIKLKASFEEGGNFQGFYSGQNRLSRELEHNFAIDKDMNIVARFGLSQFALTVVSNNQQMGTVSGSANYNYGQEARLEANPKPYCAFVAWVSDGDTLSKEKVYMHPVTKLEKIEGVFSEQYYSVDASVNPPTAGRVDGAGKFSAKESSTTVKLEPKGNDGYKFINWTITKEGGEAVTKTENTYYLLNNERISANYSVVANFDIKSYDLQVEVVPQNAGEVIGERKIPFNSSASLEARPSEGYSFVSWQDEQGGELSQNAVYQGLRLSENKKIKAVFELKTYNLQYASSAQEMGKVVYGGSGEASGGAVCKHFDNVELRAEAEEGYEFVYWYVSKNPSGAALASDTLSKNATLSFVASLETTSKEYTAVFRIKRKNLQVRISPEQGGSVEGNGLYEHGTSVVLSAQAAEGYKFGSWFNQKGDQVASTSTLKIDMLKDTLLELRFTPEEYKVNVLSTVAGTQVAVNVENVETADLLTETTISAPYNSSVKVYAKESGDYKFVAWYEVRNGIRAEVSQDALFEYQIKGDAQLSPSFLQNTKNIKVNLDQEAGHVLNAGNRPQGELTLLTAVCAEGYSFVRWEKMSGEEISKDSVYGFEVSEDLEIRAVFEKRKLNIALKAKMEEGSLVLAGESMAELKINGEAADKAVVEYGSEYTIEANAKYGYKLVELREEGGMELEPSVPEAAALLEPSADETSDAGKGAATGKLTRLAKEHKTYVAIFSFAKMNIDLEEVAEEDGRVEIEGSLLHGSTAHLSAICAEGKAFEKWVVASLDAAEAEDTDAEDAEPADAEDAADGSENAAEAEAAAQEYFQDQLSLYMDKDYRVKAVFKDAEYRLSLTEDIGYKLGGEISQNEEDYIFGSNYVNLKHGETAYLYAREKEDRNFASFASEKDELVLETNPAEISIKADLSLKANYKLPVYRIELRSSDEDNGFVDIEGSTQREAGSIVNISTQCSKGYKFSHWTFGDAQNEEVEDEIRLSSHINLLLNSDTILIANFAKESYFVSLSSNINNAGSIEGEGSYLYEENAYLSAKAFEGYEFKAWEIDGLQITDEQHFVYPVVDGNVQIKAVFEPKECKVEVRIEGESDAVVDGEGFYNFGDTARISVNHSELYRILGFHNGEYFSSRDKEFEFVVKSDTSFVLQMERDSVNVVVLASGGIVDGEGKYSIGENITLTATPYNNYEFVAWKDFEGKILEEQPTLELIANQDYEIEAIFTQKKYMVDIKLNGNGTVVGGGEYVVGSNIVLVAVDDSIHKFVTWRLGERFATDEELSKIFTQEKLQDIRLNFEVDRDIELIVDFEREAVSITTSVTPLLSGTCKGMGYFAYGASTVLEAEPAKHYYFYAWTLNGEIISREASLTIENMQEDQHYVAVFEPMLYAINTSTYPSGSADIYGAGKYHFGDTAILIVEPKPGYKFLEWTDGDFNVVSEEDTMVFVVSGNNTLTANLKKTNATEDMLGGGVELKVYPQPAYDIIYFEASREIESITIYSLDGIKVLQKEINSFGGKLQVDMLSRGMYIYKLNWKNKDQKSSVGKFVLR